MYELLRRLPDSAVVLDLGCGEGSFSYEMCRARIVAVDVSFQDKDAGNSDARINRVCARSEELPLGPHSIDAVICHHALEHFGAYEETLGEIRRVLRPEGWLWISVPDGYTFDDGLYRFVFAGGGHVNRFSREGLLQDVRKLTGLQPVAECDLFSSFHYLRKVEQSQRKNYPRTARFVTGLPRFILTFAVLMVNFSTRVADKLLGSRFSRYGWAFVFSREPMSISKLPSCFNVCRRCGSGFAFSPMKARTILGLGFSRCPQCGELNGLVSPPKSLD